MIPQPLLPANLSAPSDSDGKCLGRADGICFLSAGSMRPLLYSLFPPRRPGLGAEGEQMFAHRSPRVFPVRPAGRCAQPGSAGWEVGFPPPHGSAARAPFLPGRSGRGDPAAMRSCRVRGRGALCRPRKLRRSLAPSQCWHLSWRGLPAAPSWGDTVPRHPSIGLRMALTLLWHLAWVSRGTSGSFSPGVLLAGAERQRVAGSCSAPFPSGLVWLSRRPCRSPFPPR